MSQFTRLPRNFELNQFLLSCWYKKTIEFSFAGSVYLRPGNSINFYANFITNFNHSKQELYWKNSRLCLSSLVDPQNVEPNQKYRLNLAFLQTHFQVNGDRTALGWDFRIDGTEIFECRCERALVVIYQWQLLLVVFGFVRPIRWCSWLIVLSFKKDALTTTCTNSSSNFQFISSSLQLVALDELSEQFQSSGQLEAR